MNIKQQVESGATPKEITEALLKESFRVFSNYRGGSIPQMREWVDFLFASYEMPTFPDPTELDRVDKALGRQRRMDIEKAVADELRRVEPDALRKLRSGQLEDAMYYDPERDQIAMFVQGDGYEVFVVEWN